ncbi:hypothetical protein BCR42DRAFT_374342 [Absidia repens]|uniref:Replication protein A subunit n=1 Tax=Absidia repens TaxID=90262 RepID=A0A1X2IIJ5_9FUNG|nr:hypothetical protein BCR42DRAFT_374342 [Absidia repens]
MDQVTQGAVKILHDNDLSNPLHKNCLVQVINVKSIATSAGGTRYRIIVSDGTHFMQAMLAAVHSPLIDEGQIKKFSIVRLTEAVCNEANNRKILIILHLDVVSTDTNGRIGEPVSIEGAMPAKQSAAPQQQQQQQQAQPLFMQSSGSSYATNSVNKQLEASLFPIKGLNPYQNKWVIKARVTQKSDIKTWSNARSEGKLFSVNLLDQSGEIKATAFKDQVDRLYPLMEEGKVYYISHARVTMAKKQFSTLNNEYELSFDHTTEVELCSDEQAVPEMNYDFVKIADMDKKEKGSVVDALGVVREDAGIQEIVSKASGRPAKKRELAIVDETQKQIRVTLWDRMAESFDATGTPIVAFKGLRVNDFNGRSLSLSSSGSVKRDPTFPEAQKLEQWYKNQGQSASYTNFTNAMATDGGDFQPRNTPKLTIQESKDNRLGESDSPDYFMTRATIMFIKSESHSYPACPECRKKMLQETQGWRCERCQRTYEAPEYKYVLAFSVEDATSHMYCNAFDEVSMVLLKKSANELAALRETDDSAFRATFTDATYKTYNFKIKAFSQVFNDMPRTKYQVVEAQPVDFAREGQELAAAIDKLLI